MAPIGPFGPGPGQFPTVESRLEKELRQKAAIKRFRRSKDVPVPVKDILDYSKEDLQFMVEEDAESNLFKSPPFTGTQSDFAGKSIEQSTDMLREGADAVALAPDKEKEDAKNWFMKAVYASGRALARTPGISQGLQGVAWAAGTKAGQSTLAALDTLGTIVPSTALGIVQGFIPGEQQYERLLKEKREEYGLAAPTNSKIALLPFASSMQFAIDAIKDPSSLKLDFWNMENLKAQRDAWHETDAPWGVKFAAEVIMDPLNLVPGWVFTKPVRAGLRPVGTLIAPATRPAARYVKAHNPIRTAQLKGYKNFMEETGITDPWKMHDESERILQEAKLTKNPVKRRIMESRGRHMREAVQGFFDEEASANAARIARQLPPDVVRWLEPEDNVYKFASYPHIKDVDGSVTGTAGGFYPSAYYGDAISHWDMNGNPVFISAREGLHPASIDPLTGQKRSVTPEDARRQTPHEGEQFFSEEAMEAAKREQTHSLEEAAHAAAQEAEFDIGRWKFPTPLFPVTGAIERGSQVVRDATEVASSFEIDAIPKGPPIVFEDAWQGLNKDGSSGKFDWTHSPARPDGDPPNVDYIGYSREDGAWDELSRVDAESVLSGSDEMNPPRAYDPFDMHTLSELTPENVNATILGLESLSDRINSIVYNLTGMRGRDIGRILMSDLRAVDGGFLKNPDQPHLGPSDNPKLKLRRFEDGAITYRHITPRAAAFIWKWAFGPEADTIDMVVSKGIHGEERTIPTWHPDNMPVRSQLVEAERGKKIPLHPDAEGSKTTDAVFLDSNWNEIRYNAKTGDSGYIQGLNTRIGASAWNQGVNLTRGSFRDFFATQSILDGIDIHSVQLLMGHKPGADTSMLSHYILKAASILVSLEGKHLYATTEEAFTEQLQKLLYQSDTAARYATDMDGSGQLIETRFWNWESGVQPGGVVPNRGTITGRTRNELGTRWNSYMRSLWEILHATPPDKGKYKLWRPTLEKDPQFKKTKESAYRNLEIASRARSKAEYEGLSVSGKKKWRIGRQIGTLSRPWPIHPDDFPALEKFRKAIDSMVTQDELVKRLKDNLGGTVPAFDEVLAGFSGADPTNLDLEKYLLGNVNESILQRLDIAADHKGAVGQASERGVLEQLWFQANDMEGKLLAWVHMRTPKEILEFLESPTDVPGGGLPNTRYVGPRVSRGHNRGDGADWDPRLKQVYADMWAISEGFTAAAAYFHRADILGRVRLPDVRGQLLNDADWNIYKKLSKEQKDKMLLQGKNLYNELSASISMLESRLKNSLGRGQDIELPREISTMMQSLLETRNSILRAEADTAAIARRSFSGATGRAKTQAKALMEMVEKVVDDLINSQDIKALGQRVINYTGRVDPSGARAIKPQLVVSGMMATAEKGVQAGKLYVLVDSYSKGDDVTYILRKVEKTDAEGTLWELSKEKTGQMPMGYEEGDLLRVGELAGTEAGLIPGARIEVYGKVGRPVAGWTSLAELPTSSIVHPPVTGTNVWDATKIAGRLFGNWSKVAKRKKRLSQFRNDRKIFEDGFEVKLDDKGNPTNIHYLTTELQKILRVSTGTKQKLSQRGLWTMFTTRPIGPRGVPEGDAFIVRDRSKGPNIWVFNDEIQNTFKEIYEQELHRQAMQSQRHASDKLFAQAGAEGGAGGGRDIGPPGSKDRPGGIPDPDEPSNLDRWNNKHRDPDGEVIDTSPPPDSNGAPRFGEDPEHLKWYLPQFIDSRIRQITTNRMKPVFRTPLEWVFGQNVARTVMGSLLGAHRAARVWATSQGDQVLHYFYYGSDLFGYSSRYGRAMNVRLVYDSEPLLSNLPPQAHFLTAQGEAIVGDVGTKTDITIAWKQHKDTMPSVPSAGSGMDAAQWEARRMTTILETPEHDLAKYYILSDDQLKFYQEYHNTIARLQDMSARAGFRVDDYVKGMMRDYYVPHIVNRKAQAAKDASFSDRPVLGSNPQFFEERVYTHGMIEGETFLSGSATYIQDPVEALRQLTTGVYGWVADKQLVETMLRAPNLGKSVSHMKSPILAGSKLIHALEGGHYVDMELAIVAEAYYPGLVSRINNVNRAAAGGAGLPGGQDILKEKEMIRQAIAEIQSNAVLRFKDSLGLRNPRGIDAFMGGGDEMTKELSELAFQPEAMHELKVYVENMSEHFSVTGIGRLPSMWSSMVRTLSTTFDLGVPLIHGFMLLTMTPTIAAQRGIRKYKDLDILRKEDVLQGRESITKADQLRMSAFEGLSWHKTPWAQASVHMMRAFISKDGHKVRYDYLMRKSATTGEMAKFGCTPNISALRETTGEFGIEKLSEFEYLNVGGREITTGYKGWNVSSATKRAENTFNTFIDMLRIEYWEALRPLITDDAELRELAAIVNKITGTLDPVRAGISNHQRQIESTYLMFAPMLRRATAALIWKAGEGAALAPASLLGLKAPRRIGRMPLPGGGEKVALGLERRQALLSIGSLVTAATAMGAMVYFSGNNKKVFDTTSADFMTAKIGGVRVGIGTPYYALMRMASDVIHQMTDGDPGGIKDLSWEDHAIMKWARSSMSPLGSTIVDIVNGRTFIGDPLRDADGSWEKLKLGRYLGRQALPFWGETLMYDFQGWNKLGTLSELVGLRTSPLPKSQQIAQLRLNYLLTDTDPDLVKWRNEQIANGEPVTVDEAPVLFIDLLDERHEDILEIKESMETSKFFQGDPERVKFKEFIDATEKAREEHFTRLTGISAKFESGEIDHREFRRQIGIIDAWLRGIHHANGVTYKTIIEDLDVKRLGRLEIGEGYIGDILYDMYRAEVTGAEDLQDEYGNFIPENFAAHQDNFRNKIHADDWEYVQARAKLNKELPPLIAELEKARQDLKPFWEMSERVFGKDTGPYRLIQSYYSIPTNAGRARFMLRYPQVKAYMARVDARKDAWRLTHPALSMQLEKFYGYSPIRQKIESGRSKLY